MNTIHTDVLICGGGPVGLLMGYQLRAMGVEAMVVEKHDVEEQAGKGRACTLYPRTLEMLDQIGLLNDLLQIGYIARSSVTYKEGKRVTDRGWNAIYENMYNTNLDYVLNIRQKYSEQVFRKAYEKLGDPVYVGWVLKSMSYADTAQGVRVKSTLEELTSGTKKEVISKYIIGADGGSSTIRNLAEIQFHSSNTTNRWVRLDGIIHTNMPDDDLGFAAIESPQYGNVLWCALDHGRRRLGFSLTKGLQEKYGTEMTEDQVKFEAARSLAPFTVEIEKIDWHTVYSLRQGVADSFFTKDCVFLAGDACHVHSSALAQGMNTGVHDAVNLAWKLAGVLKGFYKPSILQTYESERKPAAQYLIDIDKEASALVSGEIPKHLQHLKGASDVNAVLKTIFDSSIRFNIGLGVHYGYNVLNERATSGMISSGWRAPDALVYRPASRIPQTLFSLTKNSGLFWVLIFAGEPQKTSQKINVLSKYLTARADGAFASSAHINHLTIVAGFLQDVEIGFGHERRLGQVYYDKDHSAHSNYSFTTGTGGIAVLRPDGILGMAVSLDEPEAVDRYFAEVLAA